MRSLIRMMSFRTNKTSEASLHLIMNITFSLSTLLFNQPILQALYIKEIQDQNFKFKIRSLHLRFLQTSIILCNLIRQSLSIINKQLNNNVRSRKDTRSISQFLLSIKVYCQAKVRFSKMSYLIRENLIRSNNQKIKMKILPPRSR